MLFVRMGNFLGTSSPFDNYDWMCSHEDRRCLKGDVEEHMDNWSVRATLWSAQALNVTFDTPNGTITCNAMNYDMDCRHHRHHIFNDDANRLYILLGEYLTEEELRDYLNDASNWENSTWARYVSIQRFGLKCNNFDRNFDPFYAYHPPYNTYLIEHCLSQAIDEEFQLLFSPPICLIVIACNIIEVICMFLTAHDKRKEIFLTVADAISSFLTCPDPTTL